MATVIVATVWQSRCTRCHALVYTTSAYPPRHARRMEQPCACGDYWIDAVPFIVPVVA